MATENLNNSHVSICLGSNIDREKNLRLAVDHLRSSFGHLVISPVYETAAVGFNGDDFFNLVACIETDMDIYQVSRQLKQIEDLLGRDRNQPRFSARNIDLDFLTYDQMVLDEAGLRLPRPEILKYPFVLKPMSDIMGRQIHPIVKKTYIELWLEMEPSAGRIDVVDCDLG
jgi:2-amino-4-hydroxy-6-hydroxymethyldihydropteridine diphosphokinase